LIAYPPADGAVRSYFISSTADTDRALSFKYASFLIALFNEAVLMVNGFNMSSHRDIAARWHAYLAEGQTGESNGKNRINFYAAVINQAEKVHSVTSYSDITCGLSCYPDFPEPCL